MKLINKLFDKYYSYCNKTHTTYLKRQEGVTIGEHSLVFHGTRIDCYPISYKNRGGVKIGNNCCIGRGQLGYHGGMPFYTTLLSDGEGSKIVIGDNCRINGAYIHAKKGITIGDNCVMGSGVNIIDSNGHQVRSLDRTKGSDDPKEIVIGNNVWICMNVTILKGSTIGDNSVIAAGSVIQGSVPPNSIASSNNQFEIKEIEF